MMNFEELLSEELVNQKNNLNKDKVTEIKNYLLNLFSQYLPKDCLKIIAITYLYKPETTFEVFFKKGNYFGVFSIYEHLDGSGNKTSLTNKFCLYSDSAGTRECLEDKNLLYYFIKNNVIPNLAKSILSPE